MVFFTEKQGSIVIFYYLTFIWLFKTYYITIKSNMDSQDFLTLISIKVCLKGKIGGPRLVPNSFQCFLTTLLDGLSPGRYFPISKQVNLCVHLRLDFSSRSASYSHPLTILSFLIRRVASWRSITHMLLLSNNLEIKRILWLINQAKYIISKLMLTMWKYSGRLQS